MIAIHFKKLQIYLTSVTLRLVEVLLATLLWLMFLFKHFLNTSSTAIFSAAPMEMIEIAYTPKTSHSCGLDNIDPCIAKESVSSIANPLA